MYKLENGLVVADPKIVYPRRAALRRRFADNMMTVDQQMIDSTGVFLIGELERLDQTLHTPLVSVSWNRDIDLREDVTIADEVSSFTNSSFAAAGGIRPNGKAWISKDANAITGIALDIGKTANPLTLWGMECKWTIPELESAKRAGRPIDQQKYDGMQLKWNMDVDEQVYVGDTDLGFYGLANSPLVATGDVAQGVSGFTVWEEKTPREILKDIDTILTATWRASAYAKMPDQLRLPPEKYSYLNSQLISDAGNQSILAFIMANNILKTSTGRDLNIQPLKWLVGEGVGGTPGTLGTVDRMMCYSRDMNMVRFPMTTLQRTPLEYRSIFQITTYFCRLGVVEFVYAETLRYADGI